MPKNKRQKAAFGLLMGIVMVYGMETYNKLITMNSLSNKAFVMDIKELIILVIIVNVIEIIIGGPLARKLAFKIVEPERDKPILVILTVSVMTVCIMCPSMSLVATFMFKMGQGSIMAVWIMTTILNFPMALCWQLFVAGPLVRGTCRRMNRCWQIFGV